MLCLNITKINYLESDSWSLNRHWLMSPVAPNFLLTSCGCSAGHGGRRGPCMCVWVIFIAPGETAKQKSQSLSQRKWYSRLMTQPHLQRQANIPCLTHTHTKTHVPVVRAASFVQGLEWDRVSALTCLDSQCQHLSWPWKTASFICIIFKLERPK